MTALARLVNIAGAGVAGVAGIELVLAVFEKVMAFVVAAAGGRMTISARCRGADSLVAIGAGCATGSGCSMVGLRRCRLGTGGRMASGTGTAGRTHATVAQGAVAARSGGRVVVLGLKVAPIDGVFVAEKAIFRRRRHDTHLQGAIHEHIVEYVADRAVGAAGIAAALEDRVLGDDVAPVMSCA